MKNRRSPSIKRRVFKLKIIQNYMVILVSIFILLILSGITFFFWVPAGKAIFEQGGVENPAAEYVILFGKVLVWIGILLAFILAFVTYIISSRFLGPLSRLNEVVEEIEEEKIEEELRFRKGDEREFHYLATTLNQVFKEVRKYREMRSRVSEFNELLSLNKRTPQDAVSFIKELENKSKKE
ncbi:hypothetical protein KAX29_03855 [candidate division WOR-3 bacterium]|nr:hypothetical protein [candidate division WOR-3 bacterium]